MLSFAIIAGLASIATAVTAGAVDKRQVDKARSEARGLADISRLDEQREFGRLNRLAQQQVDLGEQKLGFEKEMLGKGIVQTKEQEEYLSNKADTSRVRNSVQSLLGTEDEDWLYKGRVLGRFAI